MNFSNFTNFTVEGTEDFFLTEWPIVFFLIFGFFGNLFVVCICVIVIRKETSYFITYLACFDMFQLVVSGIFNVTKGVFLVYKDETLCKLWMYTINSLSWLTQLFVLLATFQLYIYVTRNSMNNKISWKKRTRLALIAIIISLLYSLPTYVNSELHDVAVYGSENRIQVISMCLPFPKTEAPSYMRFYDLTTFFLSITITGMLFLLCGWMKDFLYIHFNRSNTSEAALRERHEYVMSALMYFMVANTNIFQFFRIDAFSSSGKSQICSSREWSTAVNTNQVRMLNSMMNPLVYILFDKNVLLEVNKLLCRKRRKSATLELDSQEKN